MISVNLTRREEKQDLYGQILIYTFYYLNCRNVSMDSECDNRESNRAISMKRLITKEFVIDAIITLTISLFILSILMIPLYLFGITN